MYWLIDSRRHTPPCPSTPSISAASTAAGSPPSASIAATMSSGSGERVSDVSPVRGCASARLAACSAGRVSVSPNSPA